jgi:CheY-like chemotaxis protein
MTVAHGGAQETTLSEHDALTILIADDSASDRRILEAIVRRLGHQVITARDGHQAVALFRKHQPQIVLLDVIMPRMDGTGAASRIKALAGEALVPVIFITSLSDAESMAQCLESGGDDFLAKPYNPIIIEAKINAFNRMRLMHLALTRQKDLIQARNQQLLRDQEVARHVFDSVAHNGCLAFDNIRYHTSPLSVFSGDVLLAAQRPSGSLHILIGDFTGHGLSAAIGAMPMAEIFYNMTGKGFESEEIIREINQKLKRILPSGMFCCAAFIEADSHLGYLKIWNGGLPDGYLIRRNGDRTALKSLHLPLGVLQTDRVSTVAEHFRTEPGDTLLIATDGLHESQNRNGEMFGEERLGQSLSGITDGREAFSAVMAAVADFTGERENQDDITLFSLVMVKEQSPAEPPERLPGTVPQGPVNWQCAYELSATSLVNFNPLPLLLHICTQVPGLWRRSGEIYTLLSEMYNNALEHGILELPSAWKSSSEGFKRYYIERERRLSQLEGHRICFTLQHTMTEGDLRGGELRVTCEDSGKGFEHENRELQAGSARYASRGLQLLGQLCHSLTFNEAGNQIEVLYRWSQK